MKSPNPDSFDSDGNRPVRLHGIRIALHLVLATACVYLLLAFISDKQWHQRHPGSGASQVPVSPSTVVLTIAFPLVTYLMCVLLLSARSEEAIAAGAGVAMGLSPFLLFFSIMTLVGLMFFSFYPEPYFVPMAISLVTLIASSVWIFVSAIRIGKTNWFFSLLAAAATFVCIAYVAAKSGVAGL